MLKFIYILVGLWLAISLNGCNQRDFMKVNVLERNELKGVHSASGIEKIGDKFWLVGDNSPWIYVVDSDYNLVEKFQIHDTTNLSSGVLKKSEKHDTEAMISFDQDGAQVLLLIGSGSKEKRKLAKLVHANTGELLKEYDLTGFYEIIKEEAKLTDEELNIEAAAVLNKRLYLFNRGKNKMISLKLSKFLNFIEGKSKTIKVKSLTIDLPRFEGIQSGFSGATSDEAFNRIIFTASVENTSDWVADGEVLGSYVGIIDLKELHHHYIPECVMLEDKNGVMDIKVESVAVKESDRKMLKCVLVTDSDGGISEAISVDLDLN